MLPWGFPDVDPYHYVWDITPYVKEGKNTLAFTHLPLLAEGSTMVLRDVKIETGSPVKSLNPSSSITPAPAPEGPLPTYVSKRPKAIHMDVSVSPGGSIKLGIDGNTFDISSRTSEPDGKWVTTDAQSWKTLSRGKTVEASWTGTGYKVARRVTLRDDHVQVSDTISNTSDKLIGVIYENRVDLSGKAKPELLLGGCRPYGEFGSENPAHPSAIALWKSLALGLFAEDDVFRIHNRAYGNDKVLSISDPRLGIAPGQSHTMEWSIYPVPNGDYWDVINTVRRNWGSNITIPGPGNFEFESDKVKTPEYYKEYAESRGLKVVFSGQTYFGENNTNLAEGTAVPLAKHWRDSTAEWVKMFHAVDPDIKTMVYLHPSNCTEPGAEKLYADSKLLDVSGKQVTSPYTYPIYEYISSLDNSYGKALFNAMLSMFDTMKMDGIFMDEICRGSVPDCAYNTQWDGCTVEIDQQTHKVTRQYSSVVLLEQSWKNAMVKYMKEHDKLLVGNSPCYTRTMLGWKMPMLTEVGSYSFLTDTHLSTPLGLGTHDMENDEKVRATMVRKSLDYAGLLYMYNWGDAPKGFHYMRLMFPTTPEELHAGMILGKERMIMLIALADTAGRTAVTLWSM